MHDPTKTSPGMSRRGFLKRSGAAASLAATAGLAISRSAHAAGSDVIRIGMIGCGGRCTGAAGNAMDADPGTRLVAMTDLFPDRVQTSRNNLKSRNAKQVAVDDAHCFHGLDGYKGVIDGADVVLIACAAKFHPMYLKAGIDAGKHVFVEKPHAIDPAGINVVNQATGLAKQKKLGILSGLQSRFHPEIRETIQRVRDGQIGRIVSIEENFIRGPYGRTSRPQGIRELEVQYGNQYRFSWLSGDDVPQSLVHNMDRATWALGETPPVDAHGLGGRSGVQNLLGDVFDHHSVVYRYANGVRAYAFCRTTMGCYDENSSIILGTKGIAYPVHGRITGENAWNFSGKKESPYVIEHREFLKSIRAGEPLNCGEYMARSTLVTIMGQLSCYSGKLVTWDQVTKSNYVIRPAPEACTWDMDPPTAPDENGVYPVCAQPGVTKNI
jgi:myo-inositol 2-dehydrogenase / D-chiro-inositol 1-dehydrogenase